jgi:hypothetical protein
MKIIAIRKDFGVSDISDEEDVRTIIEKIDVESNADVQLDLSGCLIDYPATSKLMDTIVEQLSQLSGRKELEIITDYVLPMPTVVNWLFLGSKRLDMDLNKGLPYNEIIQILQTALQRSNIVLKITIRDSEGKAGNELTIPDQQS